jgi:hypothetical protein
MMNRRNMEAAQRQAERRRREDDAPRLAQTIPKLENLRLEIEERRPGISSAENAHIRRIVVLHAPALFLMQCQDPQCKDGGHDVTASIMRALRAHEPRFAGEDACNGWVGNAVCQRVLHYVGVAEYRG